MNRNHADRLGRRSETLRSRPRQVIEIGRLIERDKGCCHICKGKVSRDGGPYSNAYPTMDHVLPIARGGAHTWANVKLAHRLCNLRKNARVTKPAQLELLA